MSQVTYVELVDLYEQNYQYNCAQAAIIAVLMYEYAITLRDEVSLVWRSKATSTVIFYLNRLVMIGLVVAYMLDMFTWTTDVGCRSVSLLYIALELVTYAEWAVLSALRVYVVNTSSWVATAATLAFALVPVAYNIFASTQLTFTAIQVIPGLAVCDEVAKYSVSTARKCADCTSIRHHIRTGGNLCDNLENLRSRAWVQPSGVGVKPDSCRSSAERWDNILHSSTMHQSPSVNHGLCRQNRLRRTIHSPCYVHPHLPLSTGYSRNRVTRKNRHEVHHWHQHGRFGALAVSVIHDENRLLHKTD